MNNKLIAIGIILVILFVGLSGCNELDKLSNNISGDEGLVEIHNVTVETRWLISQGFGSPSLDYTENGFYHGVNASDDGVYMLKYMISGTLKNVAGRKLSHITIRGKFYDANDIYLFSSDSTFDGRIYDLPDTYTRSWDIEIPEINFDYFEYVDDYELEIIAS